MRFLGALVIDLSVAIGIFFVASQWFDQPPVPKISDLYGVLAVYFGVFFLSQVFAGATLGFKAWRIAWLDTQRQPVRFKVRGSGIYAYSTIEGLALMSAISLTLFVPAALGSGIQYRLQTHPLWMPSEASILQAYVPDPASASQGDRWTTAAFFYALGAWPRAFGGQPILYSLPYAKGPPQQFVPAIIARWEMPEIRLELEGPKTPFEFQSDPNRSVQSIQECLHAAPWERSSSGQPCVAVRQTSLARHIQEMRVVKPEHWILRWFEVENAALSPSERPRGILLIAEGARRIQERYILVNAKGVHQTFILDRLKGERGALAHMMLEQIVRSQRVFSDLAGSRAWVNQGLAAIRIDQLQKLENSDEFIPRVADIQLRLLSKISVDPKTFDSYFHLAGTSLLLARYAAKRQNSDWSAVAKPLVQSAYRFAQDVDPTEKRLKQLENIWLDAKRL